MFSKPHQQVLCKGMNRSCISFLWSEGSTEQIVQYVVKRLQSLGTTIGLCKPPIEILQGSNWQLLLIMYLIPLQILGSKSKQTRKSHKVNCKMNSICGPVDCTVTV